MQLPSNRVLRRFHSSPVIEILFKVDSVITTKDVFLTSAYLMQIYSFLRFLVLKFF